MKNFLLDVILIALFVAEMCFQMLPKILHEILGVAMAAAIILHVAWNWRRFTSTLKKTASRKIFSAAINFLSAICAAIILASGVCMSNYLFPDAVSDELRRNMTIHQLHVSAPYWLMILIGVHVGLHWRELRQRLPNFFGVGNFYRRHEKFFDIAANVSFSAIGVFGLIMNRVADRMLMMHIFATPATDLPAAIFALMIFGGIIFFALITSFVDEIFARKRR